MASETATDSILKSDYRKVDAMKCASIIINVLEDFIPHACKQQAHDILADNFYRANVTIAPRKEPGAHL